MLTRLGKKAHSLAIFASAAMAMSVGLPASLWLWGFTVDDALISIRVAQNLATGFGYRFNVGGPVVDAVTPLGWAHLLSWFYDPDGWLMLDRARGFGLVCHLGSLGILGWRVGELGGGARKWAVLLPLALSAPLAAWSSSGMETGLVLLLGTLAVCFPGKGLLAAGLAAGLRPELLGFALALAVLRSFPGSQKQRFLRLGNGLLLALGPFLVVAATRVVVFGQAGPLSAVARQTDLSDGAFYAAAAVIWSGPTWLVASRGLLRLSPDLRAVLGASCVHLLAVLLVGGDWMPLYRLVTPILPGLFLVGAQLILMGSLWGSVLRVGAASAISGVLLFQLGPVARGIVEQRQGLSRRAKPYLFPEDVVGTLDVGWVGASTRGRVFDFAGVTDPSVARLAGGHHAKKIERDLLKRNQVNVLVLLLSPRETIGSNWWESSFARTSEQRVARELRDDGFGVVASLPLEGTEQSYVVLKRITAKDQMLGRR